MNSNNKDLYKYYRIYYRLNQKILLSGISTDIPNIKFITRGDYLYGFRITLKKVIEKAKAEKQITDDTNVINYLLSIVSLRSIHLAIGNKKIIKYNGLIPVEKKVTSRYNIEGKPVKLDIKKSFSEYRHSSHNDRIHLKYLAKSISLYQEESPEYAIIEAFKIIEDKKDFCHYYKYFSIRNIVAHSPFNSDPNYKTKTLESFDKYFGSDDFEYLKYEREKKTDKLKTILLDFDSEKTQSKLSLIALELIKKIRLSKNLTD